MRRPPGFPPGVAGAVDGAVALVVDGRVVGEGVVDAGVFVQAATTRIPIAAPRSRRCDTV